MKRVLLFFILFAGLFISQQVKAGNYTIDENVVDRLFDNAIETSMLNIDTKAVTTVATSASEYEVARKDPLVAILLDLFVGGLGIHRFYLGTEPISGIAYFLTCGGFFGIVPLIDLVMLAVNYDDISPYVDNPHFFMWKDEF